MHMTSCFSRHWAEVTELQNNKPTMLAGAGPEEDVVSLPTTRGWAFLFAHNIRAHQGPAQLPEGTDPDLASEYSRMTADLTAEMYLLYCLTSATTG